MMTTSVTTRTIDLAGHLECGGVRIPVRIERQLSVAADLFGRPLTLDCLDLETSLPLGDERVAPLLPALDGEYLDASLVGETSRHAGVVLLSSRVCDPRAAAERLAISFWPADA